MSGDLVGQIPAAREIPVISEYVGTTIDIPEQEYYQVFDRVRGFLSAQFRETERGYQAVIQTKRGWIRRSYTPREFYDLGLAIDLTGPIDPGVWAELSGQRVFEETVTSMGELPIGVSMILVLESGRTRRGEYLGFVGHQFNLRSRRNTVKKVSLDDVIFIWYREGPVPDARKDAKTYALMAFVGMVLAEGWNRLLQVDDFDTQWEHRFKGGFLGLCCSPLVVHWFRVQRAPVHTVKLPRETRKKIDTYTYLTFR
ncbi:MAG: hypothetical protein JSU61_10490 [Fidelibacterota bacterium]|nr:MAG: hypothetical protein JSU61_10490 [Candidatus Neomarinimicrobiota bacterium]